MKRTSMPKMHKKGFTANPVILFATAIALGVVTVVILAIMMNAVKSTTTVCDTGLTYNATNDLCQNSTGSAKAFNYAGNITNNGLVFLSNTSGQFGTSGTVLGVSMLLVIIGAVGLGAYAVHNKFR